MNTNPKQAGFAYALFDFEDLIDEYFANRCSLRKPAWALIDRFFQKPKSMLFILYIIGYIISFVGFISIGENILKVLVVSLPAAIFMGVLFVLAIALVLLVYCSMEFLAEHIMDYFMPFVQPKRVAVAVETIQDNILSSKKGGLKTPPKDDIDSDRII